MKSSWTKEWPTEPGWYLFHGHTSKFSKLFANKERTVAISAHENESGLHCVCEGDYITKYSGLDGLFIKLELPALPKLKTD